MCGRKLLQSLACILFACTTLSLIMVLSHTPAAETSTAKPQPAAPYYPGKTWEKMKSPAELGWSEEKLKAARDYTKTLDTTAVMIIDDGRLIDEWGDTAIKTNVHSMRKSFLSALFGTLNHKSEIKLEETLAELGIDDNEPKLTDIEKQARVIDLLKARSGIYHPALYETEGMKARKPKRGSHPPRSFWYYNNWDFNALGTIFERASKQKIGDAFARRISEPTGMEDFKSTDVEYVTGPESVHPAYPFRMSARDCARFGLLFLRNGKWNDKQIIPTKWIKESTTAYSVADGDEGYGYSGYGYLWWVAVNGNHFINANVPDGTFTACGNHGQYIMVIPEKKLVIVHRVNSDIEGKNVARPQFGKLVSMILEAKEFSLGELPGIESGEYKVDPYIEFAIRLQGLGKKDAIKKLEELSQEARIEKIAVLCRMLFQPKENSEFSRPNVSRSTYAGGTDEKDWPLDPIEIIDGIPFVIVRGYRLTGMPASGELHLKYCISKCEWNDFKYEHKTQDQKQKALEKLLSSKKWKSELEDHEKEIFKSQIK
jgi:CubicO group peptidase (beta-lactamase class C family)